MAQRSHILGDRIYKMLQERGKVQKDLADYMGIIPKKMSAIITGKHFPTLEEAQKIADFFGITIAELMDTTEYIKKRSSGIIDET